MRGAESRSPSPSPDKNRMVKQQDGDSQSPRDRSQSPVSHEKVGLADRKYEADSPYEVNGQSRSPSPSPSPSPREVRTPVDEDVDEPRTQRGSESP